MPHALIQGLGLNRPCGQISRVLLCGHATPLFWGRSSPDPLHPVADVHVEALYLIHDVTKNNPAVGIVCDGFRFNIQHFNNQLYHFNSQHYSTQVKTRNSCGLARS